MRFKTESYGQDRMQTEKYTINSKTNQLIIEIDETSQN